MNEKKLEQLKKDYLETPIPEELEMVVKNAIKGSGVRVSKRDKTTKALKIAGISLVASLALVTIGVNSSPVIAQTMSQVPVVGSITQVLTLRNYNLNEEQFQANINVPAISGLENEGLQTTLNEKYLKENEALYAKFQEEMKSLKEKGGGHIGIDSGYVVKTDNDTLLSIQRYVVNTAGSSSETVKYDTIDKKRELLLTLPSLFKDDSYVDVISKNIKEQMIAENEASEYDIYWVEGSEDDEGFFTPFEKIDPNQNFYITSDHKLVISFDEYEVAPGCEGVVEMVIPTDVISDILVSDEYIN